MMLRCSSTQGELFMQSFPRALSPRRDLVHEPPPGARIKLLQSLPFQLGKTRRIKSERMKIVPRDVLQPLLGRKPLQRGNHLCMSTAVRRLQYLALLSQPLAH